MRKTLALAVLIAPFAFERPAHADVALGTNFGAGVAFPHHDSATFFVGWPYSFQTYQLPGVRFTAEFGGGRHEIYLDSSLSHTGAHTIDPNDRVPSQTAFVLVVAYQHIFDPHQSNSFFFNAGGGPLYYDFGNNDAVTLMAGGGVGFRQRIAGGHGTFREELRLDFVVEHKGIPQAAVLGFKFGWDLWFR